MSKADDTCILSSFDYDSIADVMTDQREAIVLLLHELDAARIGASVHLPTATAALMRLSTGVVTISRVLNNPGGKAELAAMVANGRSGDG